MADKGKSKGLDKEYEVSHPLTGETRIVTQRQWKDEKLGRAGWEKPPEMIEEQGVDEDEFGGAEGETPEGGAA
jgi:hypothetical protein